MPAFEHDGFAFAYDRWGSGIPMLFSHGLGASRVRVRPLVEGIQGAELWLYDNRNHGETRPFVGRHRLGFVPMGSDMAALRHQTGLRRVVAGGVSMGAAIALTFALQHPDQIRALVLSRPAWACEGSPPNLSFAPELADAIEKYGPERAFTEFSSTAPALLLRRRYPYFYQILREVVELNDSTALVEIYRGIVPSRPFSSPTELSVLHIPCLVCDNPNDPFHPLEIADRYCRALPQARRVTLPDPAVEPEVHAAAFRAAVSDFLQSLPEEA